MFRRWGGGHGLLVDFGVSFGVAGFEIYFRKQGVLAFGMLWVFLLLLANN